MFRLKKHIAFLLFGIFFFPIIFQSLHVVRHHSHNNKVEHHICHHKTTDKCCPDTSESISQEEKICAICEYHFSLNDIPKIFIFRSIIPEFICSINQTATQQGYQQVFRDKSPRAPPAIIS